MDQTTLVRGYFSMTSNTEEKLLWMVNAALAPHIQIAIIVKTHYFRTSSRQRQGL